MTRAGVTRAGVAAVMAGLALSAGPLTTAAAAGHQDNPIATGVWLDPTAPTTGQTVIGVRRLSGHAQVPEGVQAVSFYVVAAGHPLDLTSDQPVATAPPSSLLGLGVVDFGFDWDSAATPGGVVDVHVVAATLLRDVGVAVEDVQVVRSGSRPTDPSPGTRPAATRPAARPVSAAVVRRRDAAQDGVFLGGFAPALPYERTATSASAFVPEGPVSVRPVASTSAPPRSGWLSAALGLMLVVGAAHVHRVLRAAVPPIDPRGTR